MNMPRHLTMLVLLLIILVQGVAQGAGLTEVQVRGTIGALHDLEATFGKNTGKEGPPADLTAYARSQAEIDQAMVILRKHGFDSVETWISVAQRVVTAYMSVKMAQEQPGVAEEMRRARAEIEASPDMTPEQKQQMLAMMEQSMASVRAMSSAPSEDVATVRKLLPELDAVFGGE